MCTDPVLSRCSTGQGSLLVTPFLEMLLYVPWHTCDCSTGQASLSTILQSMNPQKIHAAVGCLKRYSSTPHTAELCCITEQLASEPMRPTLCAHLNAA